MSTLTVRSTRDDNRVVLFERDERHPDGEAFVATQKPTKVGDTPHVRYLIAIGQLVQIEADAPATTDPVKADAPARPGSGTRPQQSHKR